MTRLSAVVAIALLTVTVAAQEHAHPAPPAGRLGTVRFTTSCSAAAQPTFIRGVALLHSFAFAEATDAFNRAATIDPGCAMAPGVSPPCAWGNPFAAGNKASAQLQRGLDAIERAKTIGARTEREQQYVLAASRLFENFRTVDQRTRALAYRDAMATLAARYPEDSEASIFYALALAFCADPTDKTYADQLKAGAILEKLVPGQPDHPGLAHYIIHVYDVPALAPRALEAARRYAKIAPAASHALHMPSHTFTRLGLWQDSIDTNMASAASARREGSTAEELHASDYLMYAYLQTGRIELRGVFSMTCLKWQSASIRPGEGPVRPLRPGISRWRRCRRGMRSSEAPGRKPRHSTCHPHARFRSRMPSRILHAPSGACTPWRETVISTSAIS